MRCSGESDYDARVPPSASAFERVYDPSTADEAWYINDHTVVRDRAGTWHLIGITHAEPANPFDETLLCHATAPNLRGPWTRHPPALAVDRAAGETHLWAPHVIQHDDLYWMFYCAGGADKHEYRIHLATSPDCWTWTRHAANPLVVDGFEARDPMVFRHEGRWLLYYTATSTVAGGNHVVAAAESEDLVSWRGRRIVYTDVLEGTGAGPTESPFVVSHGGRFYLFLGPDYGRLIASHRETGRYDMSAYRRTRVLVSDDPLHFAAENQVATISSHAAEVVVDEVGDTWITHCGWGMCGFHVARLSWDDE